MLVGASGSGKTSLALGLLERLPGMSRAITCTTREPRPGEVDGRDYRFLDRARFETVRAAGGLVEWTEYAGNLYGLPGDQFEHLIDTDLVCVLDEAGVRHLRSLLGPTRVKAFRLVSPGSEQLKERMLERGSDSDETLRRLTWESGQPPATAEEYEAEIDTARPFEAVLASLVERVAQLRHEA